MGKRKSSAKAAPKKKSEPLSTSFKCLFCHHDKSVSVKLDRATMFGTLNCKTCGQRYTAPINNLSAAVDVYCDWVDACEEVRQKQPKKQRPVRGPDPLTHGPQGGVAITNLKSKDAAQADDDAEGEDDVDDDDARAGSKGRVDPDEDDVDDLDDVDDVDDDRGDKRRRVAADFSDDEDDD